LSVGQRKVPKQKEVRSFLKQFSEKYGSMIRLSAGELKMETLRLNGTEIIYLDGKPSVVKIGTALFPTLVFNELLKSLPKVIVDMGAIPHICNGADVMAPGVRRIEGDFPLGAVVVVTEDKYGKFLAVGETAKDSEELKRTKQGKVVLNRHYVGDDIWKSLISV